MPGVLEYCLNRIFVEIIMEYMDVIRSRQPAKISGNSSCHRRLLFLFKKNNERKSSISNATYMYSVCIYWSACLRLQIFTNKHRYISSNPNISRYFPLIGDEIVDGEGLNYPGYIFSFFYNFFRNIAMSSEWHLTKL